MATINDIANEFGISEATARCYLSSNSSLSFKKAVDIREYAKRIGYSPKHRVIHFSEKQCVLCGTTFTPKCGVQKYCPECGQKVYTEQVRAKAKRQYAKRRAKEYWHGGCFRTKADQTKRMEELRAEGFSNAEIAKKIGRSETCVFLTIGKQPEEMTRQNKSIARKIVAQKNAARKQFVINKPIIEYNNAIAEKKMAEQRLKAIQEEVSLKQAIAEKNAREKVKVPSVSLTTTQIAG